jgi:hypothetical protein
MDTASDSFLELVDRNRTEHRYPFAGSSYSAAMADIAH